MLAGRELLDAAIGVTSAVHNDVVGNHATATLPAPQPMNPVRAAFLLELSQAAANLCGYGLIVATSLADRTPVAELDST